MTENDRYKTMLRNMYEDFSKELNNCDFFSEDYIRTKQRQMKEKIEPLLVYAKPKIMVYGIYNGGKSTLVNAICGRAVAEVADRPMTDRITEYDAGKYILVDSPGVNAPMQHEEIADSHLEGCHMILFVISSKGIFEDRVNYEKMGNLIQKGLPFYIVLNERSVSKEDKKKHEEELKSIERKIIKNLSAYSGVPNVEGKYEVIRVNAKRAWTGIEKKKEDMFALSNIPALVRRIEFILEGRGALKQLLAPLSAMEQIIGEAEKEAFAEAGKEDYAVKREILQKKIINFREDFLDGIRDITGKYFDVLYNRKLGNNGASIGSIQDEICRDLEEDYKNKISSLARYMEETFPEISMNARNSYHMDKIAFMNDDLVWEEGNKYYKEGENLRNEMEGFSAVRESDTGNAQDIAKIAGKVVRNVGALVGVLELNPVILGGTIVLSSVLKHFQNKKKAEEEERALRAQAEKNNERILEMVEEDVRRRKEARTYANAKIDEMSGEIRRQFRDGMDQEFGRMVDSLDQIIAKKDETNNAVRKFMERCKGFRNQIAGMRKEIG